MSSDAPLRVGKASIFSSYPSWLPVKVMPNFDGTQGPANPIAGRPVPTNKWFSPLFWWTNNLDYDPYGDNGSAIALRPMPAMLQVSPWGLMLTYRHTPESKCGGAGDASPCGWPGSASKMACSNWTNWRFDRDPNAIFASMVISVEKLMVDREKTPYFVKASDFGDWDATLEWNDGERRLQLTGLAGGPMLYGTASGGELEFQLPAADNQHPITFYDGHGNSLGQAYMGATGPKLTASTDGILGMTFKTLEGDVVSYAIFAPRGTTWNFTQGTTDHSKAPERGGYLSMLRSTNLAAGHQPIHFSVAVLPPPAKDGISLNALKAFADAAGCHISRTVFTWDSWDTTQGTITTHYTFDVQAHTSALPTPNPSILTTLFKPHQALLEGAGGPVAYVLDEDGKPYSYNSPRGPLKLVRLPVDAASSTARYSVTYPYYGYVPALPDLSLSCDELSALKTYLSADSRQTPSGTADFLSDEQPDAYSTGTKLYYKVMQTVLWLQQLQQVDSIPDFRVLGQTVGKEQAIALLVDFLKAELENFFSATRPRELAYQWHFFNPDPGDSRGFEKSADATPLPQRFPCWPGAHCNPDGDPLLETGPSWKLTKQALVEAQRAGKNPYLVLRNLDFTVNAFAATGPAKDMLLHYAWKAGSTKQAQNVNMYVFYAPSGNKASPDNPREWTQCIWADQSWVLNNQGIGAFMDIPKAETPWRLGQLPYNGTSTCAPHQIPAGKYDLMLVFDCGADCGAFPSMCGAGNPPVKPNIEAWGDWELTVGPVHLQGKPYKFIAYNREWNSLLGNTSWYGSIENLADHHFGWGYLIKAAALVAQFDTRLDPDTKKPWWDVEQGWGGIVNLMVRDVMDWRKPGEPAPAGLSFARCKYLNPVEGHMYANGHGNSGDGNDEESSSEAVNFADACIEWGAATGQNDIRDVGILLRSMYAQAVPMYWFNVDGDVLPSTTAKEPFPIAGQITGAGNRHDTYFSGGDSDAGCPSRNSDVVAIETLPVTAGTLRLSLFTPQLKVAWQTVENAGGPYCGASAKCYLSTLLSFQALFDADSAKASFLARASPDQPFTAWYNYLPSTQGLKQPEDHSYATTYAFILSLGRLGAAKAEPLASLDSNPFYMPMADGSLLVYNPTSAPRSYRIGGRSVTVPALRCAHVDSTGNPVDSSRTC
ncbi:glycosyl hydrolase [Pyxidicoccus trucidator]|uniref:glycosyl hydrolase n=1 Tax=Pyxidicoccus trucidator TaxID=2709662 RepID=UPI0013DA4EFA|nr:glycosyl hydrolase [Pyxidicoccus trucidator]